MTKNMRLLSVNLRDSVISRADGFGAGGKGLPPPPFLADNVLCMLNRTIIYLNKKLRYIDLIYFILKLLA